MYTHLTYFSFHKSRAYLWTKTVIARHPTGLRSCSEQSLFLCAEKSNRCFFWNQRIFESTKVCTHSVFNLYVQDPRAPETKAKLHEKYTKNMAHAVCSMNICGLKRRNKIRMQLMRKQPHIHMYAHAFRTLTQCLQFISGGARDWGQIGASSLFVAQQPVFAHVLCVRCVCAYVYVHLFIYLSICLYIHIYIYTHLHVYTCIYMCIYMWSTRPRIERSHSGCPRTARCVVNMFHKNGMSSMTKNNGTIFYSVLYGNFGAAGRRLK